MYTLLVGEVPFKGTTEFETKQKIIEAKLEFKQ
jgi:hypothetical protein